MRHRALRVHRTVKEKGLQAAWAPGLAAPAREMELLLVHPDAISVGRPADLLAYHAPPFRSIPCLRPIWPYQALGFFCRLIPTRLRTIIAKMTRTSHLSGRWHPHA